MAAPSAAPPISVTCAAARPRATFAAPSASPVSCTCCAWASAARIAACRAPSALTIAARRGLGRLHSRSEQLLLSSDGVELGELRLLLDDVLRRRRLSERARLVRLCLRLRGHLVGFGSGDLA